MPVPAFFVFGPSLGVPVGSTDGMKAAALARRARAAEAGRQTWIHHHVSSSRAMVENPQPATRRARASRLNLKTRRAGPVPIARLRSLKTEIPLCKVLVRVGDAAGDTRTLPFLRLRGLC